MPWVSWLIGMRGELGVQAALGDKPKQGGHTIFVEKDGEKFALGTLDKDKCTHFSLDIHLATDVMKLSHTGKSEVYLTGYEAVSVANDEDMRFPGMPSSDDEGRAGLAGWLVG